MDAQSQIARRYAQAFLNIFGIEPKDLLAISGTIDFLEQHKEMFSLLKVPLLDAHIKMQALNDCLINRFGLPTSFKQLTQLLVAQKRSFLIAAVLREMAELYQDQQGIETFTITTCVPLEKDELKKLEKFLTHVTGHTIYCIPVINQSLIAGVRMQSANHRWEYSIYKQLNQLHAQLNA